MFWELNKIHDFTGSEIKLYFHLVRIWAEREGKRFFWESEADICQAVSISVNTFRKSRKRLEETGLISVIAGGKSYGDKTRYRLTFDNDYTPFEPPTGTDDDTDILPVDEASNLSKTFVSDDGSMTVIAKAHGLTLLGKTSEITPAQNTPPSLVNRGQKQQNSLPKSDDTYTSSFSPKKEISTKNIPSQLACFAEGEERPTPPTIETVADYIQTLVEKDNAARGRNYLSTIDRELIHTVTMKFYTAKAASDWRDDKSQNCMIPYWKNRAAKYFANAKWGTFGDIRKAMTAQQQAEASERFAAEKADYIKREAAKKEQQYQHQSEQLEKRMKHDEAVQTLIQAKFTSSTDDNGNIEQNRSNAPRKRYSGTYNRTTTRGTATETESFEQYWERTHGRSAAEAA